MNLKKYTKAELISKMNQLKAKNNNFNYSTNSNDNTIFKIILKNIIYFKTLILKVTLIALVIKIFKKYSIFRRLWSIISTILFSIFGISLIDIFEIEILSKIIHNILDIFNNFHIFITGLFKHKVEVPIEIPSTLKSLNGINKNSTGDQESNKIFERFNKLIHKEKEEINIEEENTLLYKNKYVIIGGILILSGLTWYFYDDIRPIGTSVLAWINSFRRRPDDDGSNPGNVLQGNTNMNLGSLKDKLFKRFMNNDPKDIPRTPTELKDARYDYFKDRYWAEDDKGKNIDFNELSLPELERRGLLQPQLTGLPEITGNNFYNESINILEEIKTFIRHQDNNSFPEKALQVGMYKILRDRLNKLAEINRNQYINLIQDDSINRKIETFRNLENEILNFQPPTPESDTYEEIALATIQEQDIWSEKGSSPSVQEQLLSPINKIFNETSNLDETELMETLKETHIENVTLRLDMIQKENEIILPNPDIFINESNSNNSSLDHYFPESEATIVGDIKAKGIKNLECHSPNISQVGLQTPIQDRLKVSPLLNKSSISNLFEDTMNLFDDPTGIDTSGDSSNKEDFIQGSSKEEIKADNELKDKSSFMNLFQQIKSNRKEYGSPIDKTSPLKEDQTDHNLSDHNSPDLNSTTVEDSDINSWSNIKPIIHREDNFNRYVQIDFGNNFKEAKKVLIHTNDGHSIYLNPHISNNTIQAFKWDDRGSSNPDFLELDIVDISIIDNKTKLIRIYKNQTVKYLDSFFKNIGHSTNIF